jgi:bacillopeptidase F
MRRSRLSKNFEKKSRRTIILSIVGIIIVLFLLFRFGIDMLVNFSTFISGSSNSQNPQGNSNQINYIAPPILNPLASATNSAQIVISGNASKDQTIDLYINNIQVDQIQTDKNGIFVFAETLKNGDNQIKTKAENNGKQSDFSNTFDVVLKNSPPSLDVSSPSDGQKFDKNSIGSGNSINVAGKTDSGVNVTVNGFWAVVDDSNNFSYTLPLQNGDNQIKIVATDQAGNGTEKDLKVNFSQ